MDQEPGLLATHLSSLLRRKKKKESPRVGRWCLGQRRELSVISTEQESVKTDEPARNDPFIPGLPFHLLRSPSSFLTMVCITTFFVCSSPRGSLRFLSFLRERALCRSVKRPGQSMHRLYDRTWDTFSVQMKTQSYKPFIGFNSNSDSILARKCEGD